MEAPAYNFVRANRFRQIHVKSFVGSVGQQLNHPATRPVPTGEADGVEPFYVQHYTQALARDRWLRFRPCCLPRTLLLDLIHKQTNSVIDGLQFFLGLRPLRWWERLLPHSLRRRTVRLVVAPTQSGDYLHTFREDAGGRIPGPFYLQRGDSHWVRASRDEVRRWNADFFRFQARLKPEGFRPVSFHLKQETLMKLLNGSPLLRVEMGLYTSRKGSLPRTPVLMMAGVHHAAEPLPDEADRLYWTKDGSGQRGAYGSLLI